MSSTRPDDETHAAETARVVDVLAPEAVQSDVLVLGPTLSDKDRLAFDLLTDTWASGAPPFIISATDTSSELRSRYDEVLDGEQSTADAYVIDCTETARGTGEQNTCSVNSPADLTGVSICLAKGLERFESSDARRLLLDNIATFLIYAEFERVYQFVSAINQRAGEAGIGTVHLLDTDAVETAERNKLFQLFDTLVEVRQEAEMTEFRVRGQSESDWLGYEPLGGDR